MPETPRILIVRLFAIGDVVMATPVLKTVKSSVPDASVMFMVGKWSAPVLECNPYIDNVMFVDDHAFFDRKWTELIKIGMTLRANKFDAVISLHGSRALNSLLYLSTWPAKFYCLSYPNRKIPATGRVDIDLGRHKVELFTELAEKAAAGSPGRVHHPCVYLDPVEIETGKQIVESRLDVDPRRLLGLCPGGGKNPGSFEPSKRWGTGRYGELARMILDETDFGIILLGNVDDSPLLDELTASGKDARRIVSITDLDLRRAAAVINNCSLIVGNDSGLMHITAALARKTITIFGPT